MKRLAGLVCWILLLAFVPVAAEDLTGTWSGKVTLTSSEGETKEDVGYIFLKQNGAELTGTAGEQRDRQWPIRNGKIEGNRITFEVQTENSLIKFELTLVNGRLKGEMNPVRGGKFMKAAVDLQRIASSLTAEEQEIIEAKKRAPAPEEVINKTRYKIEGLPPLGEEDKIGVELIKVMGTKIGFETKVVRGAPYSATAETETVQTLADGNRITSKTTTAVYRDSEGRTRRESFGKKKDLPSEIFISDPTTGVNYILETLNRVATKSEVNVKDLEQMMKEKPAKPGKSETKEEILKRLQASGATVRVDADGSVHVTREGGKAPESGQVMRSQGEANEKPQPITESLSKQVVEGIECEGTRASFTIPAGQVGNDLPIKIVREQWYSPELQVFVMTRKNDPRAGETTYRLTNINRSEPDHTLFRVPDDYTIRDGSKAVMKKRLPAKPEE